MRFELKPIFADLRGQTFWVYSLKLSFVCEETSWLARGDFVVRRVFAIRTRRGLLSVRVRRDFVRFSLCILGLY